MEKEEILEFAKLIIQYVRDSAIKSCEVQMKTKNLNSPIAKRWHEARINGNIEALQEMMISDCVDDTIFYLFQAIDEGILSLSYKSSNGQEINLSHEGLGELSGWYMGEWRSKFSTKRCFNDLS